MGDIGDIIRFKEHMEMQVFRETGTGRRGTFSER
jgi:hypothetical protein